MIYVGYIITFSNHIQTHKNAIQQNYAFLNSITMNILNILFTFLDCNTLFLTNEK